MATDRNLSDPRAPGIRQFGRVNWVGLSTLIERECRRFLTIWVQTLIAPMVTAGLFLLVFAIAIGDRRGDVLGVPYLDFLAPGLLMMTVIQNAFGNTSSSLMTAKMQGSIVDTLMPPLSAGEILTGYLAGGALRALLIALVVGVGMLFALGVGVAYPLWALVYVILGGIFMGALGLLAGIYATKFDQMSAITNFVITPLAFLSGTFYSITALPGPLEAITRINPMFYLIDGVRYGVLGVSDHSPWLGLVVCSLACFGVVWLAWRLLRTGYRLKA